MGIVKTSGVTAFESALDSVDRAQPFGAPPRENRVGGRQRLLHWEFYRNPQFACSTYFAHPSILQGHAAAGTLALALARATARRGVPATRRG